MTGNAAVLAPVLIGQAASHLHASVLDVAIAKRDRGDQHRVVDASSRLLGHSPVTTTEEAYVEIADSTLTAAFDQVDGWVATIAATTVATQGVKPSGCDA